MHFYKKSEVFIMHFYKKSEVFYMYLAKKSEVLIKTQKRKAHQLIRVSSFTSNFKIDFSHKESPANAVHQRSLVHHHVWVFLIVQYCFVFKLIPATLLDSSRYRYFKLFSVYVVFQSNIRVFCKNTNDTRTYTARRSKTPETQPRQAPGGRLFNQNTDESIVILGYFWNFIRLFLAILKSLFSYFPRKLKKTLKRFGGIKLLSYFCSNSFHHALT